MYTIQVTIRIYDDDAKEIDKSELNVTGTPDWLLRLPWGRLVQEAFEGIKAKFNVHQGPQL